MKKLSALLLASAFIFSATVSYAATSYEEYAKKRQAREEKFLNKIDAITKKNEENKAKIKEAQKQREEARKKQQEEIKKRQEAREAAIKKQQREAKKRQEARKESIQNLKDSFKF